MDSNSSGLAGKKPFFELFESLTNFLYTNTKLLTASPTEKIFEEITKTIEDLQKIKDAYKIESKRPKSQFHQAIHINTPAFPTKKILIEKIDLKPKNFIHGPTRSFGSKNDQKTQNYNAPPFKAAKELENLLKNLNLKSSVETKSSSSSHHQIKKNYSSHHDSQRNGNTLYTIILNSLKMIFNLKEQVDKKHLEASLKNLIKFQNFHHCILQ